MLQTVQLVSAKFTNMCNGLAIRIIRALQHEQVSSRLWFSLDGTWSYDQLLQGLVT